jgi:hypothetical protein
MDSKRIGTSWTHPISMRIMISESMISKGNRIKTFKLQFKTFMIGWEKKIRLVTANQRHIHKLWDILKMKNLVSHLLWGYWFITLAISISLVTASLVSMVSTHKEIEVAIVLRFQMSLVLAIFIFSGIQPFMSSLEGNIYLWKNMIGINIQIGVTKSVTNTLLMIVNSRLIIQKLGLKKIWN